jgi:hypothetical protein
MSTFHYPTTIDDIVKSYQNTFEGNADIYKFFETITFNDDVLWKHRMYIEENKLGWGDKAFHGMWKVLIDSLPSYFKFMEIGIFKGQILSLVSLIAKEQQKEAYIYGISPLDAVGDKYWSAPASDYLQNIKDLFMRFELDYSKVDLFKSLSTEPDAVVFAFKTSLVDILFVDGGHDYETVKFDIENYSPFVKPGGYLIMDDASCHLNIEPNTINTGLEDVSNATKDCLESNENFVNIFNCGHNRVFQRK